MGSLTYRFFFLLSVLFAPLRFIATTLFLFFSHLLNYLFFLLQKLLLFTIKVYILLSKSIFTQLQPLLLHRNWTLQTGYIAICIYFVDKFLCLFFLPNRKLKNQIFSVFLCEINSKRTQQHKKLSWYAIFYSSRKKLSSQNPFYLENFIFIWCRKRKPTL